MKRLILLDLDRTLFDTEGFVAALTSGKRGKLARWALAQRWLGRVQMPVIWLLSFPARQRLKPTNQFVYPDVADFLAAAEQRGDATMILTTGFQPWQNYKRWLSPALSQAPFRVVPRNKGHFLQRHLKAAGGGVVVPPLAAGVFNEIVLIEDMPATFEVFLKGNQTQLPGVRLVCVRRAGARYNAVPIPKGVEEMQGLSGFTAS